FREQLWVSGGGKPYTGSRACPTETHRDPKHFASYTDSIATTPESLGEATMRNRNLITATVALGTLAGGALVLTAAGRGRTVETVDFAERITPTQPAFEARLSPASDADIKNFRIPIEDATIEIAKGVTYQGWTFGGTVPGPTLRVRVGDSVRVTVVNESPMPHSIDFHAARVPANVAYRMIMPKDSVSFEFTARDAGAFMVHCGTPPVTMHLMQGMYLPIIVDPRDGWGTKADKEFVLVQSELYAKAGDTTAGAMHMMQPDWEAETAKAATYVAFNGRAGQYKDNPLRVDVGDRVRFFVVNA